MVKRGIYYCCRLISSQFKDGVTHSDYDSLEKVYSVFICLKPPDYKKNTINAYSLTEKTLVGYSPERPDKYDLISVIMICLGKPGENTSELLEILDTLFDFNMPSKEKAAKLHDSYGIKLTGSFEKEVGTMGSLAQGIFDDAMERGLEQGLEQGLERGSTRTILANINNLTLSTGWTVEKAMEMLRVPQNERQKLMDMLNSGEQEGTD